MRGFGDQEYWDDRARNHGCLSPGYLDPVRNLYEERLFSEAIFRLCPTPEGRVLDVGCGRGRWATRFGDLGCEVDAADLSPVMISMSTPHPRVRYQVAAADGLRFPDETFDLVVSITVLQHITNEDQLRASVTNIRRMLKPSGRFISLEYAPRRVPSRVRSTAGANYRERASWRRLFQGQGFGVAAETSVRLIPPRMYMRAAAGANRWDHHVPSLQDPVGVKARALLEVSHALDKALVTSPVLSGLSDVTAFSLARNGG